jgi:hypothetical protein
MKSYRLYRTIVGFFLLLVWVTIYVPVSAVWASGPGEGGTQVRIDNERVGPYFLLVATGPHPLAAGPMNVWVRVLDANKNQIRADAIVTVEATPRRGGSTHTAPATHENAGNDSNYLAHVQIDRSGEWDVTVYVQDQPGSVNISFMETVAGGSNLTVLIILAIPFVALVIGVGFYMWRRSAAETR